MRKVSLDDLKDKIVRPDFDAHLIPLLLYRGSNGRGALGRISRLWNFAITMMEYEVDNFSSAVKLSCNPDYAHLCGPRRPVVFGQLPGLFGRLGENPKVTENIKGLTDYARFIADRNWTYKLTPVSIYTNESPRGDGRFAPWRIQGYCPERQMALDAAKAERQRVRAAKAEARCRGKAGHNLALQIARAPRNELFYPYLIHSPRNEHEDLLQVVNAAVPRTLPPFLREDICQDLIVSVLSGDISLEGLAGSVRSAVRKVLKMHPLKYGDISLDAFIPGTEIKLIDAIPSTAEHF